MAAPIRSAISTFPVRGPRGIMGKRYAKTSTRLFTPTATPIPIVRSHRLTFTRTNGFLLWVRDIGSNVGRQMPAKLQEESICPLNQALGPHPQEPLVILDCEL